MKAQTFLFLLLLITIGSTIKTSAQSTVNLQEFCNTWCAQPALKHANIGFYILDSNTGQTVAQHNAETSLIPASNLKILTTAAALETLGPDFRFKTRLAYQGTIENDTLKGDLIVIGGGDPALGSHYFKTNYQSFLNHWITAIESTGIKYIDGNIIADVSLFDDRPIPKTWIWDDMGNYYGAGVSALNAYDNMTTVHFQSPSTPNQPTSILKIDPEIPGMSFENKVKSSLIQRDKAYVYGGPRDFHRIIRGTIPNNRSDFKVKASIPSPSLVILNQLKQLLDSSRINLAGKLRITQNPTFPDSILYTTYSPYLKTIIDVTNHESVNLFAETLLKYLASIQRIPGTTEEGTKWVTSFWEQKGLDTTGLAMMDGCGLSRFNMVTPEEIVHTLYYIENNSPYGDDFFNSLPTAPNGTLWYFRASDFPNHSLKAKSGSETRVRCFAGTLETLGHKKLLFSIMLNNFNCSQMEAISAIKDLLTEIRIKE